MNTYLLLLKPEIILYFDKRIKIFAPRVKRDNRHNNMVTGAQKGNQSPLFISETDLPKYTRKLCWVGCDFSCNWLFPSIK